MAHTVLGLDITDEMLSAVVVEHKTNEKLIHSCASVKLDDVDALAHHLALLVEEVGWKSGPCVSGLPLSVCSLRNLNLPFSDKKKIAQILPLELEDQLIVPVDQLVIEYGLAVDTGIGSQVIVTGVEKSRLRQHLKVLKEQHLDPHIVTLGILTLATQLIGRKGYGNSFLLLYIQLHSFSMAICHKGKIVFLRSRPCPEEMFTNQPFSPGEDTASTCITSFCQIVLRSIDYFNLEGGAKVRPERIILTGPVAQRHGFGEMIRQELDLEVMTCNLSEVAAVTMTSEVRGQWLPGFHDRALALALTGGGRKPLVNFRKDEFAPPRSLVRSKRQMLAAATAVALLICGSLGYLFVDFQKCNNRYEALGKEMRTIFLQSFPDVTRVVDPFVQMQAKLREVEAPTVTMPLFSMDKRILGILADISSRIPASLTIHVSRLVIDQQAVQVKGTTDAFNNVDSIKNLLAKSPEYTDVDIVSATADKEKGMVRFEIRLQLGEEF
ncbi:MAG: hypothetical protein GQ559_07385 [Desulfobulbaceae bacterium]|nr:hypothetical protein [Desulfobulbaceae bacterium]